MKHIRCSAASIALTASISGILIGYTTAVIAGALEFLNQDFKLTTWEEGFIVSIILIGAFIGASVSGLIVNRHGQKSALIMTAILFTISTSLTVIAPNEHLLIVFRFTLGLAIGMLSMMAPLYIAETSVAKWRGTLVSCFQLMITLGIFFGYLSAYMLHNYHSCRILFAIAIIPSIFFGDYTRCLSS